jgi:hypothetical protein
MLASAPGFGSTSDDEDSRKEKGHLAQHDDLLSLRWTIAGNPLAYPFVRPTSMHVIDEGINTSHFIPIADLFRPQMEEAIAFGKEEQDCSWRAVLENHLDPKYKLVVYDAFKAATRTDTMGSPSPPTSPTDPALEAGLGDDLDVVPVLADDDIAMLEAFPYSDPVDAAVDVDVDMLAAEDGKEESTEQMTDKQRRKLEKAAKKLEKAEPERGGEEAEPERGGEEAEPERGGEEAEPERGGEEAEPEHGGEEAEAAKMPSNTILKGQQVPEHEPSSDAQVEDHSNASKMSPSRKDKHHDAVNRHAKDDPQLTQLSSTTFGDKLHSDEMITPEELAEMSADPMADVPSSQVTDDAGACVCMNIRSTASLAGLLLSLRRCIDGSKRTGRLSSRAHQLLPVWTSMR